ncbi:unnamed protein product [Linum tenue]|uniref:Uncharacterized protein n=1 Tax=Linum tenue TaxID=586396 RepID=A0AAV0JYR5_9ROSI|nr:unnamed protein product [Linum tenue]
MKQGEKGKKKRKMGGGKTEQPLNGKGRKKGTHGLGLMF